MPPELPQNNNDVELEAILLETQNQGEVLDDIRVTNEAQVLEATKGNEELRELNSTVDMIAEKVINQKQPRLTIEINGGKETFIEGPQGDKGEKGDMPTKGVDYLTPQEIQDIVNQVQARVKDGKDGENGQDAVVDYEAIIREVAPMIPKGLDGKDAVVDYESIIEEVLSQIPKPKDGKDGKSVKIEDVVTQLKKEDVFGEMEKRVSEAHDRVNKISSKTYSLSELDDVDLSGATISNGKYVIGGGSGAVDSVNGQTGVVVLDADDIDDTSTTQKFVTAGDLTKLSNITVTQAVDLDTMESNIATNNSKVTNATHTGDVTGSGALTIANDAVTNAKMANMATKTYKGRTSGSTGDPEDVSVATLKSDLSLNNVDNTSDSTKNSASVTLTNKRIQPRSSTSASGDITPALATANIWQRTGLTAGITINAPTGTPVLGEVLVFMLLDNGTSRALTWNSAFTTRVMSEALPTATTISKQLLVTCQYNGATWLCLSSEQI